MTKCPLSKCGLEFESRSFAIAHYKADHASTSVLCVECKKPISVRNNNSGSCSAANYRVHMKRRHPHVKLLLSHQSKSQTKVDTNSQNNVKETTPPRSQFVKTLSIANQSSHDDKKMCKICGIQCVHLSRHIKEVHNNKRILCPLKGCDFTSKRFDLIRRHLKNTHAIQFPNIAQNNGFTYKSTTDAAQVCIVIFFLIFLFINHC